MRLDRQLLERLLSTWKKIKDVRRTNGYTTTSVRLIIKQFVLFLKVFHFYEILLLEYLEEKQNIMNKCNNKLKKKLKMKLL
jgi:hypothetical protein